MQSKVTREQSRERVEAWRASGLSCAQFARLSGVHPGTLSWWRWKLSSQGRREERARRRRAGAQSPLTWVELTPPAASTAIAAGGERAIELEVGRVRLRVPDAFHPETLARVLEVLEGRS
jgi:hypothetical protein